MYELSLPIDYYNTVFIVLFQVSSPGEDADLSTVDDFWHHH